MASVEPEQIETIERKTAELFERLIFVDCREQTANAIENEGPDIMGAAFGALGEISAQALMTTPEVTAGWEGFTKYFDLSKFDELGLE